MNCCEIDVVVACYQWARKKCDDSGINQNKKNIRYQLKDIIYEIRFNQVSLSELVTLDKSDNPYDYEEFQDIIRIMNKEKIKSTKFKYDAIFWNDAQLIPCTRVANYHIHYNHKQETVPNIVSTIFSSSKSLIFGAFHIYFEPFNQTVSCNISILRMDTDQNITTNFNKQVSIQKNKATSINLPNLVIIEEYVQYNIKLDFSTNNITLKTRNRLKQEVKLKNNALIAFHHGSFPYG